MDIIVIFMTIRSIYLIRTYFLKEVFTMETYLKSRIVPLIVFVVSLLAIAFLVAPVIAQEMTPEEKLERANALSAEASEIAARAKETGDVKLAQKALNLIKEASALISDVSSIAKDTGNADLNQKAYNAANNLGTAINLVSEAAVNIAQTSADPGTVTAANEIIGKAEAAQDINKATMDVAMTSGAVPPPPEAYVPPEAPVFEVPFEEEPPIQDTGPASPV